MSIIPHFEHNVGTFFPKKGMVSITNSLVKLAESLVVQFQYNTIAEEILVENNAVIGVKTTDKIENSAIVVSNMDVYFTYHKMLPNQKPPKKILRQERSSSAIIFYWGIHKEFPNLDLHNILFSSDYKAEFEAIFDQKTIFDDPTVYVHISSKCLPNDAPKGAENWFVMINSPSNSGQDWDKLIAKARKAIIQKINKILQIDIEKFIEEESILEKKFQNLVLRLSLEIIQSFLLCFMMIILLKKCPLNY